MTKNKILTTTLALLFTAIVAVLPVYSAVLPLTEEPTSASINNEKSDQAEIIGSILITDQPAEISGLAKNNGLKVRDVMRASSNRPSLVVLSEKPDHPRVKALDKRQDVTVTPNYVYKAFFTPNDTNYNDQWNLPKISAPQAWDITTGSSDVTVAVIDSGVLFEQTIDGTVYNQPDFPDTKKWINAGETGNTQAGDVCWDEVAGPEDKQTNGCDDDENGYIDDWQGWDWMGGYRGDDAGCPNHNDSSEYESSSDPTLVLRDNDPQPYSCDSPTSPNVLNKDHYDGTCQAFESACYVGHGTMVASVIAAQTNNNELIAGLDHQVKIMNVRALDGYGWGSTDRLVGSLYYAADNGADVINLSLGSNCGDESFSDPLIEEALQNAADKGVVIAAASGNGNLSTVCYPASSPLVMAIGATDIDDERESYSSYSNKLDVVAPAGVPVLNAPSARINSNYYPSAGGTSLSTPHVAGLAALIKSVRPESSRDETREIIHNSADKVDGMQGENFHKEYGYGRINAQKAIRYASLVHPDGVLIKAENNPKVFLIEGSQRRHITGSTVLASHGYTWSQVKSATTSDMQLPLGQPLKHKEGTLVKGSSRSVYVINYAEGLIEKRHITSMKVFEALGYTPEEVRHISDSAIPSTDGAAINTADTHPDGTLVKSAGNPQVYIIEDQKLRHVVSRKVFESHGFDWDRIKQTTDGDLNLPSDTALSLREGSLIRGSTKHVYVVNYESEVIEKRHIASFFIFELLGYSASEVLEVSDSSLPEQDGPAID